MQLVTLQCPKCGQLWSDDPKTINELEKSEVGSLYNFIVKRREVCPECSENARVENVTGEYVIVSGIVENVGERLLN